MTLRARLARLERNRPAQSDAGLDIDLAPDLEARVTAAQAAGTFPASLSDDDLLAMQAAIQAARGSPWAKIPIMANLARLPPRRSP